MCNISNNKCLKLYRGSNREYYNSKLKISKKRILINK